MKITESFKYMGFFSYKFYLFKHLWHNYLMKMNCWLKLHSLCNPCKFLSFLAHRLFLAFLGTDLTISVAGSSRVVEPVAGLGSPFKDAVHVCGPFSFSVPDTVFSLSPEVNTTSEPPGCNSTPGFRGGPKTTWTRAGWAGRLCIWSYAFSLTVFLSCMYLTRHHS